MMRALFSALLVSSALASGEIESDIPLGLEAVTGLRSGYVYRGVELADTLLDFQLEAEIALGDQFTLNTGAWFASESGAGFSEFAAFLDARMDVSDLLTLGTSVTYHDFNKALLRDGVDVGLFATLYATEDLDFTFGAYRDFGNESWYAKAEAGWSHRLGEDSYLGLTGGVSWVNDLIGRNGMNDFYGRASVTYNINSAVSLTPFVGWSKLFDSNDTAGDEVFGGLWFEVIF
ncbi:MAG: hypothetical protein O3A87_11140 [Verrucomicrobia bacterium]|nr:hypothetical protein [Verrucomicrobiota bacterium]MDA1007017.1 hypothetical protein [Verrucomicrobiota bacterium]